MPLRRSQHGFSRAIWTIRNGMQIGRMAVKGVKSVRKYMQKRNARQPSRAVAKVREKLAIRNPLYANKKLYRKDTPAGQKRRAVFAEQLRENPGSLRPKRSRTIGLMPQTANRLPRKPYSGKIPIAKGMTGRQVKRNIVRHEIKKFSGEMVKKNKGNRQQAAREIKDIRKSTRTAKGSITRTMFHPSKMNKYVKAASRILSRKD